MERPRVRGYRPAYSSPARKETDIITIISTIPPLTRVGGVCLVAGKLVGLLAIPAVFIPSLQTIGTILVITWGTLVFTAIVLCSYEHFRSQKKASKTEKIAMIHGLIAENPELRDELLSSLEAEEIRPEIREEEEYERCKVIHLNPRMRY